MNITKFILSVTTALTCLAHFVQADSTLTGLVRANELSGPPLPLVQVMANGANPTVTRDDGHFQLKFPQKQPGDLVQLVLTKPNLVVVNDVLLHWPIPRDPDPKHFVILLSTREAREEFARKYYRLIIVPEADKRLLRMLKELEAQGRADATNIASLTKMRDDAVRIADLLIEQLVRLTNATPSHAYVEAMQKFISGDIDGALAFLNSDSLLAELSSAEIQHETSIKRREEATKELLFFGNLYTLEFQPERTEELYKQALAKTPDSFDINFALGNLYQSLNRPESALEMLKRCADIARTGKDPESLVRALNSQGVVLHDQLRFADARSCYEEALGLVVYWNKDSSLRSRRFHAIVLNNLASIYDHEANWRPALDLYTNSLALRRQVAAEAPDAYSGDLALTLNNLGIFFFRQNDLISAAPCFHEAVDLSRALAKTNATENLPKLAAYLNSLGTLYFNQHQASNGLSILKEALEIRHSLYDTNHETYAPDYANALYSFARVTENEDLMTEAAQMFMSLETNNPERYHYFVASAWTALGMLQKDHDQLAQARTSYTNAIKAWNRADAKQATISQGKADTIIDLAVCDYDEKRYDDAERGFSEGLRCFQDLAVLNPARYEGDVAKSHRNLAWLFVDAGKPAKAYDHATNALHIYLELSKNGKPQYTEGVTNMQDVILQVKGAAWPK